MYCCLLPFSPNQTWQRSAFPQVSTPTINHNSALTRPMSCKLLRLCDKGRRSKTRQTLPLMARRYRFRRFNLSELICTCDSDITPRSQSEFIFSIPMQKSAIASPPQKNHRRPLLISSTDRAEYSSVNCSGLASGQSDAITRYSRAAPTSVMAFSQQLFCPSPIP